MATPTIKIFTTIAFGLVAALGCTKRELSGIEVSAGTTRSWLTMGTVFRMTVYRPWPPREEWFAAARATLDDIDRKMSLYKEDSDLSRLKRLAGSGKGLTVDPETLTVLKEALRISEESRGCFDATVEPLAALWNFHRPWKGEEGSVPAAYEISSTRRRIGSRGVMVDEEHGTVWLREKGMGVDFGGIAKGYALDRAVEDLSRLGVQSALLDFGGQLRVLGKDPNEAEWQLAVRDSRNGDVLRLRIPGGSISTSNSSERYFVHQGKRYGHVLDPRTGWPVTSDLSVTAWAPTGLEADAWSTAFLVANSSERKAFASAHPEIGFLVMKREGGHTRMEVYGPLLGRFEEELREFRQ